MTGKPNSRSSAVVGDNMESDQRYLREREHQLRVLTDHLPGHVAYVGANDLCYRFVNRKFKTSFGRSHKEIKGSASLLLSEIDDSHPHFERLNNIEKYVNNGSELTKQLLGFARGGKYNVKSTAIRDLVTQSAKMFGRTKKEVNIHARYQEDLWPVKADQGQNQFFGELLAAFNVCQAH